MHASTDNACCSGRILSPPAVHSASWVHVAFYCLDSSWNLNSYSACYVVLGGRLMPVGEYARPRLLGLLLKRRAQMESLCTTAAGDGNGDGITGTELRALNNK